MKNKGKFRAAAIGIVVVTWAAGAVIVMLLWNALLPRIFGLPQLNYLEALGIFALARILFGGLHGFGPGGGERGIRERGSPVHRANRLREKWMTMSEDERKEFVRKERDYAGLSGLHTRLHEYFDDEKEETQAPQDRANRENSNE